MILEQIIHFSLPYAQITVSVHVATTQIYQDHNVSYSKNQIIILTVVVEALSHRFSTPTSAECICKKCHKDLLQEIMPMNSVALCIKLTSHKPQQTCIHCNTVPTVKYLTFDKTKYRENTIVSQMTEKDEQNIICNKCHNAICYDKNLYIKI